MSQSRAPRRSWMPLLAIATVLGFALVGLTQCRRVSDSLTGVQLNAGGLSGRSECVEQCNERFKVAQRAENDRYRAALAACGTDPACRAAETARHRQNLDQIEQQKKDCKKNCYGEGGGSTGN